MYIKSIFISVLIVILGATAYGQDQGHQHNDHLTTLLEHYMNVKDALTEDDFKTARSHINDLEKEVLENEEMNNHEEHSELHAKHHSSMIEAVEKADTATDIDELRSAFKNITVNLTKALENQGYDQKTLYIQYCPMAGNNKGATWISEKEKIVNPYMGPQMQSCGKTEKTIKAGS